jgi:hypothetical protein
MGFMHDVGSIGQLIGRYPEILVGLGLVYDRAPGNDAGIDIADPVEAGRASAETDQLPMA